MQIIMKPMDEILRKRGLNKGGRVQKFIDSECIRRMAKYTPKDTGKLIESATIHTVIGSGKIKQSTPYARKMYYENRGRGKQGTARGGHRGRMWFARMKQNHGRSILRGARKLAGSEDNG